MTDRLSRRLLDESNAIHRARPTGFSSHRFRPALWLLLALATVWGLGQFTGPAPRDLRSVEVGE